MSTQANFSPEAMQRLAEAVAALAAQSSASNDAEGPQQPTMYRSIDRYHEGLGPGGANWDQPLPLRFGYQLAGVERCLSGIAGLALVLHADADARVADGPEAHFNYHLRDRLFFALRELSDRAYGDMGALSESLQESAA